MARPRTGRQTSAEYQRRYRERKKAQGAMAQTNWMLDVRLTDAVRHEAKARGLRESELATDILGDWYEARFGGRLPAAQPEAPPDNSAPPPPPASINATVELLLAKLEELGFIIPLQGMATQCLHGDERNGLWATVTLNGLDSIEFGLIERTDGLAQNILHCLVDTVTRRAWLTSDAYGELNQDRDIGTKISTKGLLALDDAFARLREFIMAKRKPLRYEETLAALPHYLDQEPSRSLLVLAFQRMGLELVHVPPTDLVISAAEAPQNVALHDLNALAQYVRQEFLRMGENGLHLPAVGWGRTHRLRPRGPRLRLRRAANAATGCAQCRGRPAMNTIEADALAAELRKAAQDLLLCVNAIMGQEQSIAADLLRNFPKRLELLALRMAPRPQPDLPPDWPLRSAPSETHLQALLERQRWWLQRRSERNAS